jgi:hypothetical protein
MAAYLTVAEFKTRAMMPPEYVDQIETRQAGWTLAQLEQFSRWIDSRLRKRYAVPFAEPYPEAVKSWLARLVTVRCFIRRGIDPTDLQFQMIEQDAKTTADEIREAAESQDGLFDLPLNGSTSATGISKGGPLVYSEQSPYVGFDLQGVMGRNEDSNGRGSGG